MKKLALVLCSALLFGACSSSITAPRQELRTSTTQTPPDTVKIVGGHGMGSGN